MNASLYCCRASDALIVGVTGLGATEGIVDGVALTEDDGDGVGCVVGIGVGCAVGVAAGAATLTIFPLLQTNFFPLFLQVKTLPL
jgi:hypothetical protein